MKLYVWTEYARDYTSGLAVAIANDPDEARRLIIDDAGYTPSEMASPAQHVIDLNDPDDNIAGTINSEFTDGTASDGLTTVTFDNGLESLTFANPTVELIVNGRVAAARNVPADGEVHDLNFGIEIEQSSWVALRQFPQLHTNPVNVIVDGQPIRASRRSAQWCIETIDLLWKNRGERIAEAEFDGRSRKVIYDGHGSCGCTNTGYILLEGQHKIVANLFPGNEI